MIFGANVPSPPSLRRNFDLEQKAHSISSIGRLSDIKRARAIRDQDAIRDSVARLASQILPSPKPDRLVTTADVAAGPTTRSGKRVRGSVSTNLLTPTSAKRSRVGNPSDSATSGSTKRLHAGSTPGLP